MDWTFIILTLKLQIAINCQEMLPTSPEIYREKCFKTVLKCTIERNSLEECISFIKKDALEY